MPLLKTVERIFIGYSIPQASQRDICKAVIQDINASNHHKNLQLLVCEYRQMVVDTVPLQEGIDRVIESCDLAILLFGPEIGGGLAYEAQFSLDLLKTGKIYKLLPYVFVQPGEPQQVRENYLSTEAIEDLYDANQVLFYRIEDESTFESRLREHLGQWLAEEESIVERQKDFLRRGLLGRFAVDDIAFSNEVLGMRQAETDGLSMSPDTEAAFHRYVETCNTNSIMDSPIEYYLVARHLRAAILADRWQIFTQAEFINPIHQYLATLIRHDEAWVRDAVITKLEGWLEQRQTLPEMVRNFAVFQLGMLQSRGSAEALMRTVENRGELQSVRHYAAHALGMLRQRSMIQRMMQAHAYEHSPFIKETLTNSIIYMMGVIE